jgi:hypothetical protein
MRLLRPATEAEMVATFLRGELDSERFGPELRRLLALGGHALSLVTEPDLTDAAANAVRASLLDDYRAYERRDGLFGGFPHDVEWTRAALTREEVLSILYIDWDWWLRLSGGTRRPFDAAARIRAGLVPGAEPQTDEPIAARLGSDDPPPPLIVVTTPAREPLVLLEGHVRLTAYALFPDYLPAELEVLLGVSDGMEAWSEF